MLTERDITMSHIVINGNIRLINARLSYGMIVGPPDAVATVNIASGMIASYERRRASVLPQMIVVFVMAAVVGIPYMLSIRADHPAEFVTVIVLMALWAVGICCGVVRCMARRVVHPIRVNTLENGGCEVRANVPCFINIIDLDQRYYLAPC